MAIFNSYVKLPEGSHKTCFGLGFSSLMLAFPGAKMAPPGRGCGFRVSHLLLWSKLDGICPLGDVDPPGHVCYYDGPFSFPAYLHIWDEYPHWLLFLPSGWSHQPVLCQKWERAPCLLQFVHTQPRPWTYFDVELELSKFEDQEWVLSKIIKLQIRAVFPTDLNIIFTNKTKIFGEIILEKN